MWVGSEIFRRVEVADLWKYLVLRKIKHIDVSIGFCTLFTWVIVKELFKLIQRVFGERVFKLVNYLNLLFVFVILNQLIVISVCLLLQLMLCMHSTKYLTSEIGISKKKERGKKGCKFLWGRWPKRGKGWLFLGMGVRHLSSLWAGLILDTCCLRYWQTVPFWIFLWHYHIPQTLNVHAV